MVMNTSQVKVREWRCSKPYLMSLGGKEHPSAYGVRSRRVVFSEKNAPIHPAVVQT